MPELALLDLTRREAWRVSEPLTPLDKAQFADVFSDSTAKSEFGGNAVGISEDMADILDGDCSRSVH